MTDTRKPLFYEFEDFRVDRAKRLLLRDGDQIALTPKVFETLLVFLEHRGEVLEKDRLMELLWSDSFVEESNLAQNVAVLRRALGEKSKEHRFIVTIPGRGYRFVADVKEIGDLPQDDSLPKAIPLALPTSGTRTVSAKMIAALAFVALVLAVAMAWFLWPKRSAEIPVVSRTQQITTWSGLDFYPSLSRDANTVAFCSDKSGAFQIYIKQLVRGASEIQLTNDDGQNFQPAISPDGNLIAFHSKTKGGIWVIPITGGRASQVTQFGSNPEWSPDGTRIAFQSDGLNDLGSGVRNAMPPSAIWTVSSAGGEPTQLTRTGDPPGGHGAPAWSPDGKRIVFDVNDWGASQIWSIAVDGTGLKRLVSGIASETAFSEDGRFVYYVTVSGLRLHRQEISSDGDPIGEPVKIFDSSGARIRQISVAGGKIVYASISTASNLSANRLDNGKNDGSDPIRLTQAANTRSVTPSFSPDGKRIAFVFYSSGSESSIWTSNTDGSDQRELTPGFNPWWFPDGNRISFSGGNPGATSFFSISSAGGIATELFKHPDPDSLSGRISPDGRLVVFNSKKNGTINLWALPTEGGEPKQLTFDKELAGFPAWSPDGKWLAFQLKRGDNTHVAIMPAGGGEPMQLTFERGQSWIHDWTPDNDRIVFAGQRDNIWNIYTVSITTKKVEKITNFEKLNIYVRYPAWSPLNNLVIYEYAETTGNIWMMELNAPFPTPMF